LEELATAVAAAYILEAHRLLMAAGLLSALAELWPEAAVLLDWKEGAVLNRHLVYDEACSYSP
jgi:hypothetical protein